VAGFEDVARLIDQARDIPSIAEIGLSGGEPFLFPLLLRQIIRYSSNRGLPVSVTTNGFWARSARAVPMLRDLAACGLNSIHISTSVFHQEFLSVPTVIAAARLALDAGIHVAINLVSTGARSSDTVRAAFGALANRVRFVEMPFVPAGRGASCLEDEEADRPTDGPFGNCREDFRKLTVTRSGDIYPCCSPGGFTLPLQMGNIEQIPLRTILDQAAQSKLLAILESVGPAYFLPFLRQAGMEAELPERFNDKCHLCHAMLSSPRCARVIAAASNQLVSELAAVPAARRPEMGGRLAGLRELGAVDATSSDMALP
jgi:pyruvate-formate lyase-activating enzyme